MRSFHFANGLYSVSKEVNPEFLRLIGHPLLQVAPFGEREAVKTYINIVC